AAALRRNRFRSVQLLADTASRVVRSVPPGRPCQTRASTHMLSLVALSAQDVASETPAMPARAGTAPTGRSTGWAIGGQALACEAPPVFACHEHCKCVCHQPRVMLWTHAYGPREAV